MSHNINVTLYLWMISSRRLRKDPNCVRTQAHTHAAQSERSVHCARPEVNKLRCKLIYNDIQLVCQLFALDLFDYGIALTRWHSFYDPWNLRLKRASPRNGGKWFDWFSWHICTCVKNYSCRRRLWCQNRQSCVTDGECVLFQDCTV